MLWGGSQKLVEETILIEELLGTFSEGGPAEALGKLVESSGEKKKKKKKKKAFDRAHPPPATI